MVNCDWRDASPGDNGGVFLNAERNLLRDRGWILSRRLEHHVVSLIGQGDGERAGAETSGFCGGYLIAVEVDGDG